jgi:hypothetical protein
LSDKFLRSRSRPSLLLVFTFIGSVGGSFGIFITAGSSDSFMSKAFQQSHNIIKLLNGDPRIVPLKSFMLFFMFCEYDLAF